MIEEYLNRNVKSDATHKGTCEPFEFAAWLILPNCKDKYVWLSGEWVKSEINDPIKVFKLTSIKK